MDANDIILLSNCETHHPSAPSISISYKIPEQNTNDDSPKSDNQNNFYSFSTDSSENSFHETINDNDMNTSKEGNLLSLNTRSLKRHPSCVHLCEENKPQLTHKFNQINIIPVSFDEELPPMNNIFSSDICNDCDYFFKSSNNKPKQNRV